MVRAELIFPYIAGQLDLDIRQYGNGFVVYCCCGSMVLDLHMTIFGRGTTLTVHQWEAATVMGEWKLPYT